MIRRVSLPLLVLLGIIVPVVVGQGGGPTDRGEQPGQAYRGFVMPSRQVELAAPLEEILLEGHVDEMQRVKKGDLLARMDDRLQQVVVEAARIRAESEAELDRTRLEHEDAKMNHERMLRAHRDQAATDMEEMRARIDMLQAEANMTAARESRMLAEVNLRLEERRLERYQVRAPFAGIVVEIIAEEGAMLNENEPVLVLADLDTLEAQLHLPLEVYGMLEVGRQYVLIADPPVNREIISTLTAISPMIDTASRTFRCVFDIENEGAKLPAGFTVYLKWPAEHALR